MDNLIDGGKKITPVCVTSLIPGTDSGTCKECHNPAATLVNGRCLGCAKAAPAGRKLNLLGPHGDCDGKSCPVE
jgi:hypothetical protein